MTTIVLENQNRVELERISEPSNNMYLISKDIDDPHYPCLSQLDTVSYTVFGSSDMEELIKELDSLKPSLISVGQMDHVNDIIRLARKCQANEGFTLTFTPFGKFSDDFKPTKIDLPPDFFRQQ